MWVQLLLHVFQLPANWLVLLYKESYPLQNDTNKYVIWNNYFYFRYQRYPITLTYIAKWGLYAISGDHDNKKSKPKILQLIISKLYKMKQLTPSNVLLPSYSLLHIMLIKFACSSKILRKHLKYYNLALWDFSIRQI